MTVWNYLVRVTDFAVGLALVWGLVASLRSGIARSLRIRLNRREKPIVFISMNWRESLIGFGVAIAANALLAAWVVYLLVTDYYPVN
jgi:hypothetical protein